MLERISAVEPNNQSEDIQSMKGLLSLFYFFQKKEQINLLIFKEEFCLIYY
jgi:hypothetical protein